jgi:hypothetical protein
MDRPRAADDFTTIARLDELRQEREQAEAGQTDLQSDPPMQPRRSIYWAEVELGGGPNRDRRIRPNPQLGRDGRC